MTLEKSSDIDGSFYDEDNALKYTNCQMFLGMLMGKLSNLKM